MSGDPILWFVATVDARRVEGRKWHSSRTWFWFHDEKVAIDYVHRRGGAMLCEDGYYTHAVVESVEQGEGALFGKRRTEHWFRFVKTGRPNASGKGFEWDAVSCDRPETLSNVRNFTIC